MMSAYEAHALIQQSAKSTFSSHCSNSPKNRKTGIINPNPASTTSPEHHLQLALQSHRLNPNILFQNNSLLSTAITFNCPNLLQLLLEHGANPNLKSYENGRYEPALITAVRKKSLRSVQILLEHGAKLHQTNFYGTDAVFQAVHENAYAILDCLLNAEQRQKPKNYYQKRDVPTSGQLLLCPSSSETTLPPSPSSLPHPLKSIIIQKTSSTKACDATQWQPTRALGNKQPTCSLFSTLSSPEAEAAGVDQKPVLLTGEKLSNNNPKGHSRDYDDDSVDDHVLCPFYYALHRSLSSAPKRQCLALLLQLYYKCKCLEDIYSSSNNEYKRMLIMLLKESLNKSVSVQEKVDDESSSMYPYKIYRIRGKCHTIKENESSSQSRQGVPDYVLVLEGPLKLACMAREVIRDQIMRSAQTSTCTREALQANAPCTSTSTTVAPPSPSSSVVVSPLHFQQSESQASNEEASRNNVLVADGNFQQRRKIFWRRRNFRQSLESLMMPSSLMDYMLYRNVEWQKSCDDVDGGGKRGESNFHNVRLIKRDPQSNINYLAIYIY